MPIEFGYVCDCGHGEDEHSGTGACLIVGCPCTGFEPVYDDDGS